jgi:hypothetical protein
MNRHQRRTERRAERHMAAAIQEGRAIDIGLGHLGPDDPNFGLPVNCAVCGTPHPGLGLARIADRSGISYAPLCEPCVQARDATSAAIVRKYFGAPDMKISDGGDLGEVFLAIGGEARRDGALSGEIH